MKKLVLLIVAATFTSFLFAQHTDWVYQNGVDNDSYIEQEFNGGGTSYDGNYAYVKQVGDYNESDVYQTNNAFPGGGEDAYVTQLGNHNKSDIDQINYGHYAYVWQQGNWNEAKVYQYGNNNDGIVLQYGVDNYGRITQWGNTNDGYIYQNGDHNNATQDMGSGPANSQNVNASTFYAKQVGDYNDAQQIVDGEGWFGGTKNFDNHGTITQLGNHNTAKQFMFDNANGDPVIANNASLWQQGNWNESYQYMKRDNNTSTVAQYGTSNYSMSKQNW